jgi:hypothetical protein
MRAAPPAAVPSASSPLTPALRTAPPCWADALPECIVRPIPLLAIAFCAACAGSAAPVSTPAPAPLPAAESTRRTDAQYPVYDEQATVCVLRDGRLEKVPIEYNTATGDTTYEGVPFSQAFPLSDDYAARAEWFIDNEPIPFRPPWPHVKYGYPRVMGVHEIVRVGEHRGVGIYVVARDTVDPQVIYVPVRPGCVFQPYAINTK